MTWLILAMLQTASAKDDSSSWNKKPYWAPILGGHAFSDGTNQYYGANLGAEAGLKYKQRGSAPKLAGRTRALGVFTVGSGVSGQEFRLGSFMGPWFGMFGLEVGPDFIYNQYSNDSVDMGSSFGVSVPLQASLVLKPLNVTGGLGPLYYMSGERIPVDWDAVDDFGFGDEFRYFASASIRLPVIGFGVHWSHRITAYGNDDFYGLSFGL